MTFDGQRFRSVRMPTGALRCEITDEYREWIDRNLMLGADIETLFWQYVANGMVGRLVLHDGKLTVDTSDPNANGELVIHEGEGGE